MSNVHQLFDNLLSAVSPQQKPEPVEEKLLRLSQCLIADKSILLAGFNQIVKTLCTEGVSHEDQLISIKRITLETLEKIQTND